MKRINVGLIGYGVVGQGVVKLLKMRKDFIKSKFNTEFVFKAICDRSIKRKNTKGLGKTKLTKNIDDAVNDPQIDVVVELIGGLNPAKRLVTTALKNGKHVVTANKALIASNGKELFRLAKKQNKELYFESSVGAGIPIIKTLTEGIAGNKYKSIYGIINGTCNFILSQMQSKGCSFNEALKEAQARGFAESNPTLDINGMDSAHKLAILTYLAFGKFLNVKDIYTEGITEISHDDIEYANSLNLSIKLLAIAKRHNNSLEVRVHPTIIANDHPLASIKGVFNAVYMHADPLGEVMLSGEGAGAMAAATGVVSDLINLSSASHDASLLANIYAEAKGIKLRKFDQISSKFYLRFMASDKPGALAQITGILAKHNISINSVSQKQHGRASSVPVIMLTEETSERNVRLALNKIKKLAIVKGKPVAIRMEKL